MDLEHRLAQRLTISPIVPLDDGLPRAAVAAVLQGDRVLLMKRAERQGDPWSGHISLPGGRYQPADRELLVTAMRESEEELGLDLRRARTLGALTPLKPFTSGPAGLEVTPFVFALDVPVELRLNAEAVATFWLPLGLAASGELDAPYEYPRLGTSFPSWRYEGNVVWGLTLRILNDVLAAAE